MSDSLWPPRTRDELGLIIHPPCNFIGVQNYFLLASSRLLSLRAVRARGKRGCDLTRLYFGLRKAEERKKERKKTDGLDLRYLRSTVTDSWPLELTLVRRLGILV